MIIFIVPKNSGLKRCREIVAAEYPQTKQVVVRGEDIPSIVTRLLKEGKKVIGITGEDLFKEFLLNFKNSKLSILKKFIWEDDSAMFGKPCLCLLGPKEKKMEELPKNLKVCINKKYTKLAKRYLSLLEARGYTFEKFYLSGVTEESFNKGLADLVIEIVYSGKSAEEAGLRVYEKIFESDIVIIGTREKEESKALENFSLNDLLKKINEKISSSDEDSYTKKLVADPEILKRKLIEEAAEVITSKNKEELIWECSDLIYFLFVIMAKNGVTVEDIEKENERRDKK
ncbi:ATP phosphoribosyltransferase [uncultured archaeon]|nr:ATP phosphoribosyltransferase [uncultured archaeon]